MSVDKALRELDDTNDSLFSSKLELSPEPPESGNMIPLGAFDLHVTGTADEWAIDGLQIGEFYRPLCPGEDIPLKHVARKYIEHLLKMEGKQC
jgi:hypothetical protein